MSITYDHAPSTPTGLSTSPATACPSSSPTVVGDGNVSLDVPVSDPDGGTLGVTIEMWDTATGAAFPGTPTDPQQLFASSGSTAVFIAHQADLEAAAAGAVTEFSWKAQVTDYYRTSPWSATCSFYFDPTHPGTPVVTAPASATISQPATFTVTPPASGPVPAAYSYQLNAGASATVTASSSGDASITVVPTRAANTLTVTSLSAGGNFGGSATVSFNAAPAPPAADSDLNGDGKADLLTVGSSANGLPPGLWLATGRGNGQVVTAATDIGVNGNGTGAGSPADFNGAQVITGHFGGTGLQDVLAYYPSNSGQANILFGNGTGAPLQAQVSGNEQTLSGGTFTDLNGDNPLQLANAGDTSGQGHGIPDLIAINGDSVNGYYLEFDPDNGGIGRLPDRRSAGHAHPHRRDRLEPLDDSHRPTILGHGNVPVELVHWRPVPVGAPRLQHDHRRVHVHPVRDRRWGHVQLEQGRRADLAGRRCRRQRHTGPVDGGRRWHGHRLPGHPRLWHGRPGRPADPGHNPLALNSGVEGCVDYRDEVLGVVPGVVQAPAIAARIAAIAGR